MEAYTSHAKLKAAHPKIDRNFTSGRIVRRIAGRSRLIDGKLVKAGYSLPLLTSATGAVELTANATATKLLTIGSHEYEFVAALTVPAVATEILVGSTKEETAENIRDRINDTTEPNKEAKATLALAVVSLEVRCGGSSGNETALSTDDTNLTVTAFSGGDGDFELLEDLANDLTAAALIRGEHNSPKESGSTGFAKTLHDEAMKVLEDLRKDELSLVDSADGVIAKRSGRYPISNTEDSIPEVSEFDSLTDYPEDDEDFGRWKD